MRVPLSWLRDFVDVPADASPEDVLADLVRVGFEEEDVHRFELQGPIVVGEVLSFEAEPQTNGKTIRWCQVRVAPDGVEAADGGPSVHGIVCGAGNFFAGDKVVVTLPGAVLPGPFPIAARTTYGHVSDGMIASAKELGLGDEHSGILRLVELGIDAPVGTDAIALLGLDDIAIDVNVTPDRGYALSVRGIAREYALATGAEFHDPGDKARGDVDLRDAAAFAVSVDDRSPLRGRVGASEFVARIVRDVDPSRPTPAWMVARLTLAGVRSLGILIDITNYVMIELGQPIHGYDLDRLRGGIVVRRATAGEKLETLDGKLRTLDPEDLLITDDSGPIGLAGVMGGGPTEMTDATRNVLIEAATFDTVSIARTARRHKLPSEASRRFERGVDPGIPFVAAARVAELMVAHAGGTDTRAGGALMTVRQTVGIDLPEPFVSTLIGVAYTREEIVTALEKVGALVSERGSDWLVTPPSWRPDLTDKWTLAEEVARIHGLDRIPSILPTPPSGRGLTSAQHGRRRVANALAAAGYVETPSFPFCTEADNALHGSASGVPLPSIKLANPLDGQSPFLRRSLVPGLLAVAHRNQSRGLTDLALFETGSVFTPEAGIAYGTAFVPPLAVRPDAATLAALDDSIPPQPRHVAVLLAGNVSPKQPGRPAAAADLGDAWDGVRTLALAAGVTVELAQTTRAALHPGRAAVLTVGDREVGYLGELLPSVASAAELHGRVIVAELDLDLLLELAGERVVVASLSAFPAATQDVSLVVPSEVPAAEIQAALVHGAGELLESARLVDDYRGQGVLPGSKSLTFALRFRGRSRTLTAAEATEAKLAGVAVTAERFGAQLRE
ncbi:phenylalanine--tRNA ligase subunit beta [Microbacterium sp. P01]|uniref:phenylalanine--tRNA ligase subunit beta n=1 Tax=Microbacterium sp. P01 TaxID=3366261 RepID=UPI00366E9E35